MVTMPSLLDTLDQEEWWYGQDGYPYRLAEMEQSHRINVQAFLRRRAKNIYDRHQWHEFRIMESAPDDVFAEWMHESERMVDSDPVEWLNSTPFMQALDRAIRDHDTVEGEVVTNEVAVRPGTSVSPTGRLRVQMPRLQSVYPEHERFTD